MVPAMTLLATKRAQTARSLYANLQLQQKFATGRENSASGPRAPRPNKLRASRPFVAPSHFGGTAMSKAWASPKPGARFKARFSHA